MERMDVSWMCTALTTDSQVRQCGYNIRLSVSRAVIHSQAGLHIPCPKCLTWYGITTEGAVKMVGPGERLFFDAEGNVFPPKERTDGEARSEQRAGD